MLVCERDTCANLDRRDALGALAIPSSEDFVANLLHLKCKVVQLARRQIQKEMTGWQERTVNAELERIVEPSWTGVEQVPRVGTDVEQVQEVGTETDYPEEVAAGLGTVEPPVDVASEDTSNAATVETESDPICHWTKRILTNFPVCWIILVVGILGLTSLVCGVLLGAFICTHGTHSLPGFFRSNARIGRAVY